MSISCVVINGAIDNPKICIKVPELKDGHVVMLSPVVYACQSGKFCTVYKFQLKDGTNKAIRIWTDENLGNIKDILDNIETVSKELRVLNSPYFVQYDYHPDGILINGEWRPMMVMDWCEGEDLKKYVSKHYRDSASIKQLAHNFLNMVSFLHKNSISHGDLQHNNILVQNDGSIVLIDYDSICVPGNVGRKETIKGLPGYQLFRIRNSNDYLSPKVDYYSELVIYVSLILIAHHPEVWTPQVADNDNILLFKDEDLSKINESSSIFQKYLYEQDDDFMDLVLTLQNWYNFGQSIDSFKPLEIVCGGWYSENGVSKNSAKLTTPQEPLTDSMDGIIDSLI